MHAIVPKYISFNDKYWLVIHFSVKIQNIFELIVNIIILRSKPQGVIKYAKHLNLNRTVCLGYLCQYNRSLKRIE
jgi:hypothetical protein